MRNYPNPKPLSPEDVAWFEAMIRLQTNIASVDKPIKKKKPKDKK